MGFSSPFFCILLGAVSWNESHTVETQQIIKLTMNVNVKGSSYLKNFFAVLASRNSYKGGLEKNKKQTRINLLGGGPLVQASPTR